MARKRLRPREILYLVSLVSNAALSAWLAFRVSVSLGRPILLQPETPAYVLGILALGVVCFTLGMIATTLLLGVRFVRKDGQIVLAT